MNKLIKFIPKNDTILKVNRIYNSCYFSTTSNTTTHNKTTTQQQPPFVQNNKSNNTTTQTTTSNIIQPQQQQQQEQEQEPSNELNDIYNLLKLNNNQQNPHNNNSNNSSNNLKDYSNKFKIFMDGLNLRMKTNLVVAVSGGSDSLMLLSLLKEWCIYENTYNNRKYRIQVITIDHKMVDPISEDIPLITSLINNIISDCSSFIKHKVIDSKYETTPKTALQERFRNQRLEILINECELLSNINNDINNITNTNKNSINNNNNNNLYKHSILNSSSFNLIFYGSNLNDQIETFIQRINGQSGLDGLAVMPKITKISTNSLLVRPLLEISKREILQYCKDKGIQYFSDPTNQNNCYTRNKTRSLLTEFEFFKHGHNFKSILNGLSAIQEIKEQTDKVVSNVINEIINYNEYQQQLQQKFVGAPDLKLPNFKLPLVYFNSLPITIASRVLYRLKCIVNQEYSYFYQKKFVQMVESIRTNPKKPISSNKLFIYTHCLGVTEPLLVVQFTIPPRDAFISNQNGEIISLNNNTLPINTLFKYYGFKIKIQSKNNQDSTETEASTTPPKLSIRILKSQDTLEADKVHRDIITRVYRYARLNLIVITDAATNKPLAIPSLSIFTPTFNKYYTCWFEMDKLGPNNIKTDWEEIN